MFTAYFIGASLGLIAGFYFGVKYGARVVAKHFIAKELKNANGKCGGNFTGAWFILK